MQPCGDAIDRLPDRLTEAIDLDWSLPLEICRNANSLMTIGRGPTLAIAREAALKMKETCHLHAEAFSGAEFQHGPGDAGVPSLSHRHVHADGCRGPCHVGICGRRCAPKAPKCFAPGNGESVVGQLPVVATDHPDTDPLCLIQAFYAMIGTLPILRGTDLDRPRHLQKVTTNPMTTRTRARGRG